MYKDNPIIIRIFSIITLAAFLATPACPLDSVAGRQCGLGHAYNQPSNLRKESIGEATGAGEEVAIALKSSADAKGAGEKWEAAAEKFLKENAPIFTEKGFNIDRYLLYVRDIVGRKLKLNAEEIEHELDFSIADLLSIFNKCRKQYKGTASFHTYFSKSVRNRLLDVVRRKGVREAKAAVMPQGDLHGYDNIASDLPSALDIVAGKERHLLIIRAIGSLSALPRRDAHLHYIEGLTYKEIADRTGLPVGTAKSRVFAAKQKIIEYCLDSGIYLDDLPTAVRAKSAGSKANAAAAGNAQGALIKTAAVGRPNSDSRILAAIERRKAKIPIVAITKRTISLEAHIDIDTVTRREKENPKVAEAIKANHRTETDVRILKAIERLKAKIPLVVIDNGTIAIEAGIHRNIVTKRKKMNPNVAAAIKAAHRTKTDIKILEAVERLMAKIPDFVITQTVIAREADIFDKEVSRRKQKSSEVAAAIEAARTRSASRVAGVAAAAGARQRAEEAMAILADMSLKDAPVRQAMKFFSGTQHPMARAHLRNWLFNRERFEMVNYAAESLGIINRADLYKLHQGVCREDPEAIKALNDLADGADVRKRLNVTILAAIVLGEKDEAQEEYLTVRMGLDKVVFSPDDTEESIAAAEKQIREYAGENKYFVIIIDTQKKEVRSAMFNAPVVSWKEYGMIINVNDAVREYFASV